MVTAEEMVQLQYLEKYYESGRRAYEMGRKLKDCQLCKGSLAREYWEGRWEQARHEAEDAPPEDC